MAAHMLGSHSVHSHTLCALLCLVAHMLGSCSLHAHTLCVLPCMNIHSSLYHACPVLYHACTHTVYSTMDSLCSTMHALCMQCVPAPVAPCQHSTMNALCIQCTLAVHLHPTPALQHCVHVLHIHTCVCTLPCMYSHSALYHACNVHAVHTCTCSPLPQRMLCACSEHPHLQHTCSQHPLCSTLCVHCTPSPALPCQFTLTFSTHPHLQHHAMPTTALWYPVNAPAATCLFTPRSCNIQCILPCQNLHCGTLCMQFTSAPAAHCLPIHIQCRPTPFSFHPCCLKLYACQLAVN